MSPPPPDCESRPLRFLWADRETLALSAPFRWWAQDWDSPRNTRPRLSSTIFLPYPIRFTLEPTPDTENLLRRKFNRVTTDASDALCRLPQGLPAPDSTHRGWISDGNAGLDCIF